MAGPDAGAAHLGEGSPPAWLGAGTGTIYFNSSDGQLYFRRSDTGAIVGPLGASTPLPNPIQLPTIGIIPVPPVGKVHLYARTADRKVYSMDSSGTESGPFGAGGAATVGWGYGTAGPGALYVDLVAGNDGTAMYYDQSKPYKTINAALADAVDGDWLVLSKGVFSTTQLAFGALQDITIMGQGRTLTTIDDTSQFVPTIKPPVGMTRLRLFGLAVHSTHSSALDCDGTGAAGTYLAFEGRDLQLAGDGGYAMHFLGCNDLFLEDIDVISGSIVINETTVYRPIRNITAPFASFMRVGWDDTSANKSNGGRTTILFQNLFAPGMNVQVQDEVDIFCDGTCHVAGFNALAFGLASTGDMSPNLVFHGTTYGGGIEFWNGGATDIPDAIVPMTIDFSGATIKNGGRLDVAKAALIHPNQVVVAQGIITDLGAIVSARAGITMRVSSPSSPSYQGLGIIQPARMAVSTIPLTAGAGPKTLGVGLTFENAPTAVIPVINQTFGGPNISALRVANITATTFDLYYTGVAVFGQDYIDVILMW